MEIQYDLNHLPTFSSPIGLTIGMFDGLHLGHQHLFNTLKNKTKSHIVITFSPLPRSVLKRPVSYLTSLDYKEKLLQEEGFDLILVLPFTQEIKQMSYDRFLLLLKEKTNFSHLFLGEDATLGKNREGNKENITKFAKKSGFAFTPLDLLLFENTPITSSRIRKALLKGQIEKVKKMLGKEMVYLLSSIKEKDDIYLSFKKELCLPPSGSYSALLKDNNKTCKATIDIDQKTACLKIKKSYIDKNNLTCPLKVMLT